MAQLTAFLFRRSSQTPVPSQLLGSQTIGRRPTQTRDACASPSRTFRGIATRGWLHKIANLEVGDQVLGRIRLYKDRRKIRCRLPATPLWVIPFPLGLRTSANPQTATVKFRRKRCLSRTGFPCPGYGLPLPAVNRVRPRDATYTQTIICVSTVSGARANIFPAVNAKSVLVVSAITRLLPQLKPSTAGTKALRLPG